MPIDDTEGVRQGPQSTGGFPAQGGKANAPIAWGAILPIAIQLFVMVGGFAVTVSVMDTKVEMQDQRLDRLDQRMDDAAQRMHTLELKDVEMSGSIRNIGDRLERSLINISRQIQDLSEKLEGGERRRR